MTTSTLTVTDFLRARLAEDEDAAREAGAGLWDALDGGVTDLAADTWPVASSEVPGGVRGDRAVRVHIARHDPARVLAQCAAMRKIVEDHSWEGWGHRLEDLAGDSDRYDCPRCGMVAPCYTVRALASIWSDHPDWREEWR